MAVDFADVTDVAIPEGDVERITETTTGNVLWEKTLCWIRTNASRSEDRIFDRGYDIFTINTMGTAYRYNPITWEVIKDDNGNLSTHIDSFQCIDMDPSSKNFCLHEKTLSGTGRVAIRTIPGDVIKVDTKENLTQLCHCCWASRLNVFCVIASENVVYPNLFSFLVDTSGNLINQGTLEKCYLPYNRFARKCGIAYSPKANIFVAIPDDTQHPGQIITSSNGISWQKRQIFTTNQNVNCVYWIEELNLFLCGLIDKTNLKASIYQSSDGVTWIKKWDFPNNINSSFRDFAYIAIAYSPTKQVFLVLVPPYTYLLSKDFSSWKIINSQKPAIETYTSDLIWSPTTGAFLYSTGYIYKMYP